LLPQVEREYRTRPHRVLIGHSSAERRWPTIGRRLGTVGHPGRGSAGRSTVGVSTLS
jgi:hypothetical protein